MLGLICFFIEERVRLSNVEALFSKKTRKSVKICFLQFYNQVRTTDDPPFRMRLRRGRH